MPILIKRYPNRKLYDTVNKEYIALDRIGELIRRGEEIQVFDNVSGEDLTSVILSQVILESAKKRIGFLPRAALTDLIQFGGAAVQGVRHNQLDFLDLWFQVNDEIQRRIGMLVESGELSLAQTEELMQKMVPLGRRTVDQEFPFDKALQSILEERGVASRDELLSIAKQIDILSSKIDGLTDLLKTDASV